MSIGIPTENIDLGSDTPCSDPGFCSLLSRYTLQTKTRRAGAVKKKRGFIEEGIEMDHGRVIKKKDNLGRPLACLLRERYAVGTLWSPQHSASSLEDRLYQVR